MSKLIRASRIEYILIKCTLALVTYISTVQMARGETILFWKAYILLVGLILGTFFMVSSIIDLVRCLRS